MTDRPSDPMAEPLRTERASPAAGRAAREPLMDEWRAARRRRAQAELGSEAHREALDDLARIEIEIAALERAMDPPLV